MTPLATDSASATSLQQAYIAIYRSEPIGEQLWTEALKELRIIVTSEMRKAASRHKIPMRTWKERIDDAIGEMTIKLVKKKLGDPARIRHFNALIKTCAFHCIITVLRRIKSPMAGMLESDPGNETPPPDPHDGIDDPFLFIRNRLEPFRFAEFSLARDALLAARLATNTYPGTNFIAKMVPLPIRAVAYTAAIVSINSAMLGVSDDDDGHQSDSACSG